MKEQDEAVVPGARPANKFDYDVALSFAGSSRSLAQNLAELLLEHDVRVFYDDFQQAELWGKDLYQHLESIYRQRARYCVVFVSEDYLARPWPQHELKQAQARGFSEHREYILPVRLDDTELPGLNPSIGYVDLRKISLEGVANLLLEKLFGSRYDYFYSDPQPGWDGRLINYRGAELASFWPKKIAAAQAQAFYLVERTLERVRYGDERRSLPWKDRPCPDCGVIKGEFHVPSCDLEECPQCGKQALGCRCIVGYTDQGPAEEGSP